MAAIAFNQDGEFLFVATEDGSLGTQRILRASRDNLSSAVAVYDPAAGGACNVVATVDAKTMLFYGEFGAGVLLIQHDSEAGSNTDISPTVAGTKTANTCAPNPASADSAALSIDTDQDLVYTDDAGTSYTTWTAALGFNATALALLWNGLRELHQVFVAGDNGIDLDILYSPNEMNQSTNAEDATLGAKTDICSLEIVKEFDD